MPVCLMLDVDGVLVDGRPCDGLRWHHDLQKDMAVPANALVEQFFTVHWGDIIIGKKDLLPTLAIVLERIAPHTQAEKVIRYWFEMDSRIVSAVHSDMCEARRNGIPVFLTTNQEHMRAQYLMQNMGLGDEVDGIVYSAKAGSNKPQQSFFAFAQETTGHPPDNLLLVDDTELNVEAARSAGWNAVHWDGSMELGSILQPYVQR